MTRDMHLNPANFDEPSATNLSGSDDIDVVIPIYNGAPYIRDCVASVLSQTLKPRRVIIVDDGSTDDTVGLVDSLLRCDSSVMLHRMGRNTGVSAARNAGIRLSDAPFLAFIDADDIWAPNKLALQLKVFRDNNRPVGFIHSSFFLIDESGSPIPHQSCFLPPLLRGDVFSTLLREGNVLSGSASSVLIKRDLLDRSGGFDEQLDYGEDWDLWLRLAAIAEADHTPEAVVGIRIHPKSAQQKDNRINRFLQTMRVCSRWEQAITKEPYLVTRLRKDGFHALLANLSSLRQADFLYETLKRSEQNLARSLYSSRTDFWFGLLATAIATSFKKLASLVMKPMQTDRSVRSVQANFVDSPQQRQVETSTHVSSRIRDHTLS